MKEVDKEIIDADWFSPYHSTLMAENADVYFHRAKDTIEKEEMNPIVAMEFFTRKNCILAGMREVKELLRQGTTSNGRLKIEGLEEGMEIEAREPVLRISGPYLDFGVYETAILGIFSSCTAWATAAKQCVEAALGVPVVAFGARHIHPNVSCIMEYCAILAGCDGCSTIQGANMNGMRPTGTMPHAMILCFGDTLEATIAFDNHIDPEVRRVVLVDTFKDEVEESIRIADYFSKGIGFFDKVGPSNNDLYGVRLDTPSERGGVSPAMVKEVRAKLDHKGHNKVKIIVSGGLTPERITEFRATKSPVDMFCVGSAISGARPIDFTADIKQVDGKDVAKRGRIPGLTVPHRMEEIKL